ncbi:hypothetical protein EZS27_036482, partial [termite gut metagenome]
GKCSHIMTDFGIRDSGINLSGLNIGMPQHLTHTLNGYTL